MRTSKVSTWSATAALIVGAGLASASFAGEPARSEPPKPNVGGDARPMGVEQFVELMGRQMRQIAMGAVDQIHTLAAAARTRSGDAPGDGPGGEAGADRARGAAAAEQIGARAKGAIDDMLSRLHSQLVGKDVPAGTLDGLDRRGADAKGMVDEALNLARRTFAQSQGASAPARGKGDAPKSGETERPKPDRPASDRPPSDRPQSDRPQSDRPQSDRSKPDAPKGERGAGDAKKPEKPAAPKAGSDRPKGDANKSETPKSEKPKPTTSPEPKRRV